MKQTVLESEEAPVEILSNQQSDALRSTATE
jgi:hypothetical protein